jgi:hypothetical protein
VNGIDRQCPFVTEDGFAHLSGQKRDLAQIVLIEAGFQFNGQGPLGKLFRLLDEALSVALGQSVRRSDLEAAQADQGRSVRGMIEQDLLKHALPLFPAPERVKLLIKRPTSIKFVGKRSFVINSQ